MLNFVKESEMYTPMFIIALFTIARTGPDSVPSRIQIGLSMLMGYREHLTPFILCSGEATGNPLQCSCLENPMAGGAW